ncbi:MAG: DUF2203 family protein [Planctomycetes bacterium]|nr:DUF2203 family protein [Planctomycetota bacterium]
MNGFTEHQASGASEASKNHGAVLTWAAAQSMLPLIRRILADIVQHREQLARLRPEKARLDRQRLSLAWPERRRRYSLGEEIKLAEARLQEARAELDGLGVALVDAEAGQVGFPTIVNNRRAFFSWRVDDEAIDFWHFAENSHRRPVPPSWKDPTDTRGAGKRKSGRE